jgi:hypothetical protein
MSTFGSKATKRPLSIKILFVESLFPIVFISLATMTWPPKCLGEWPPPKPKSATVGGSEPRKLRLEHGWVVRQKPLKKYQTDDLSSDGSDVPPERLAEYPETARPAKRQRLAQENALVYYDECEPPVWQGIPEQDFKEEGPRISFLGSLTWVAHATIPKQVRVTSAGNTPGRKLVHILPPRFIDEYEREHVEAGAPIKDEHVTRCKNKRWHGKLDKDKAYEEGGAYRNTTARCPTYGTCDRCYGSGPVGQVCLPCTKTTGNDMGDFQFRVVLHRGKLIDSQWISSLLGREHKTAPWDRKQAWDITPCMYLTTRNLGDHLVRNFNFEVATFIYRKFRTGLACEGEESLEQVDSLEEDDGVGTDND